MSLPNPALIAEIGFSSVPISWTAVAIAAILIVINALIRGDCVWVWESESLGRQQE